MKKILMFIFLAMTTVFVKAQTPVNQLGWPRPDLEEYYQSLSWTLDAKDLSANGVPVLIYFLPLNPSTRRNSHFTSLFGVVLGFPHDDKCEDIIYRYADNDKLQTIIHMYDASPQFKRVKGQLGWEEDTGNSSYETEVEIKMNDDGKGYTVRLSKVKKYS